MRYVPSVIRSFADKRTARIFAGIYLSDVHPDLQEQARAKLHQLDEAERLDQLGAVPGNRLERLGGNRRGQWSIRVSGQWRICFRWESSDSHDVWFGDYH
jgi:proteic killer suppression protein